MGCVDPKSAPLDQSFIRNKTLNQNGLVSVSTYYHLTFTHYPDMVYKLTPDRTKLGIPNSAPKSERRSCRAILRIVEGRRRCRLCFWWFCTGDAAVPSWHGSAASRSVCKAATTIWRPWRRSASSERTVRSPTHTCVNVHFLPLVCF
jgi:hypothetical protein